MPLPSLHPAGQGLTPHRITWGGWTATLTALPVPQGGCRFLWHPQLFWRHPICLKPNRSQESLSENTVPSEGTSSLGEICLQVMLHSAIPNWQNQRAKEKDENYRQFSDTYCTLQEKWEKDETDLWSLQCLLFYVAVQYSCNSQLLNKMILCSWAFFYQLWRGVFCFILFVCVLFCLFWSRLLCFL